MNRYNIPFIADTIFIPLVNILLNLLLTSEKTLGLELLSLLRQQLFSDPECAIHLRTMILDLEVPLPIPATSHLATNCSAPSCRSQLIHKTRQNCKFTEPDALYYLAVQRKNGHGNHKQNLKQMASLRIQESVLLPAVWSKLSLWQWSFEMDNLPYSRCSYPIPSISHSCFYNFKITGALLDSQNSS